MFNEANTVEAFVCNILCGKIIQPAPPQPGLSRFSKKILGVGWHCLPSQIIPRQPQEVFVETFVRDALIGIEPRYV